MGRPEKIRRHGRGQLLRLTWEARPELYAPSRYRRPCSFDTFVPDVLGDYLPQLDGAVVGVVSDAESRIHSLNKRAEPALAPLARLLLRTESIASSKVEGLQVDARALARAEVRHETGRPIGPEAREVIANVDAMQLAVEEAAAVAALGVQNIHAIHHALMTSTSPATAGHPRTDQNWIGGNDYNPCGADFVPPPPEEVGRLLDDLAAFCNDDILPPLVQAAVAHAQFETIHPYSDGNGRTGRALVQVILRRRALAPSYVPPISVVLAAERDRYIAGLTSFRDGRDADWIQTFAVAAARAAELATGYLEAVIALQEGWRQSLRAAASPRADAAAWALIDVLPAHPIVTGAVGVAATGRSRPAVDQGIRQLAAAGVLSPLGEGSRNRAWEAPALLELLAPLENAQPTN